MQQQETVPIQTLLGEAIRQHQAGALDQAEALYRRILAATPTSSPKTCISARRRCDMSTRWRRRRCRPSRPCRPPALCASSKSARNRGNHRSLAPRVSPERVRYVFTDVSDLFLDRAKQKFASYPFMEFGRFDLEQEIAPQGYARASFDVIVSANAVHAATELRAALRRLRELLAPGGLLDSVRVDDPF